MHRGLLKVQSITTHGEQQVSKSLLPSPRARSPGRDDFFKALKQSPRGESLQVQQQKCHFATAQKADEVKGKLCLQAEGEARRLERK